MSTVRLAANTLGGVIQGNYGTYNVGSDGVVTVDTRDAPAIIAAGATYITNGSGTWTTPAAPRAASAGRIVASGSLASGAVSIANQPDTIRQVNVIVGAGTVALTSGAVTVTYIGQDNQVHTDTLPVACAASATTTQGLSRGVVHINTITIGAVAGGATPFIRADDTALIGVPSDPNAVDFVLNGEFDTGVAATPGTFSTTSLGCTTVANAPNGTQTYTFVYGYVAPTV